MVGSPSGSRGTIQLQRRSDPSLRFGEFVLDEESLELRMDGELVAIRPKPARLLACLARHAPRLVPKAKLLREVWPGVAVSDDALYSAVKELRQALGAGASARRSIESRRGVGYRLLLPVENAGAADEEMHPPLGARPSLVVLPLLALSRGPDDEVLADGLSEDLTTRLAARPGFFVIARTSAFAYKGRAFDVRAVGRELGARYAIEGSVRRAGARLRVAVQLVETEHGRHLWAERWDHELGELFELEDEIVASIAAQLDPAVVRGESRRVDASPQSVDAWLLYQRALDAFYLRRQSREDLREALERVEQALARSSGFARARALRGLILGSLESQQARGIDRETPLAECRAAHAAAPDDPFVLRCLATVLSGVAGPESAVPLLEQAVRIDPNDAHTQVTLGIQLSKAGRGLEAIAHIDRAIALSPKDPRLWFWHQCRANTFLTLREWSHALAAVEKSLERNAHPAGLLVRAALLARDGQPVEARACIDRAREAHPELTLASAAALWNATMPRDRELKGEVMALLSRAGLA
jgi:TolB-like protein